MTATETQRAAPYDPKSAAPYDPRSESIAARVIEVAGAVQEFADSHRPTVKACFIRLSEGTFDVTVLGSEMAFNFDLNEELAKLTTELVKNGLPVAGLLLPASVSHPLFSKGRVIIIRPS
jgi:hypothetical protein